MKQTIKLFILISILCVFFSGCEDMAELFHGPKPEEPPVTYKVTFNANGATEGKPPAAQTVKGGAVISLPHQASLLRTGFDFVGWSENPSGTPFDIGSSVKVTRDMVFYARWFDLSTPKYTVTFHANGANGTPPLPRTVYSGVSITLPTQENLSLTNKNFAGWNTLASGQGTGYTAGATLTVTGDIDLYAKWLSIVTYTITFNLNGATGSAPASITEDPGTVVNLPGQGSMVNPGKDFTGWNTLANGNGTSYAGGSPYTMNATATLYAQWESVPQTPPGSTLAEQLAYIRNHTGNGTVFNIAVENDVYLAPTSVTTMGVNIIVNIRSADSVNPRTIQLDGQGHLFSIDTGVTLRLQDIVLRGINWNDRALVAIGNATLILNSGAIITGNTNILTNVYGGGIYINGGTLEMNEGCEISENSGHHGGGIYVDSNASVIIRNGIITNNHGYYGGGMYIRNNSTVTMSGGIISKNSSSTYGGGIYIIINNSSFTKRAAFGSSSSGIIYGGSGDNANISQFSGQAICRSRGSTLASSRNTTLGPGDEITTLSDVGWGQ
jgi:hypothetical protein